MTADHWSIMAEGVSWRFPMPKLVDARGLPCPQPVLLTKKAMAEADDVLTIVDSPDQADNVSGLARKAGWAVHVDGKEDGLYVRVRRQEKTGPPEVTPEMLARTASAGAGRPLVLVAPSEFMARGENADLGTVLVRAFFHTLLEVDERPDTAIFLNSGVKLVVEDSPLVEDLQALASGGLEILVCGTCLDFYELKERVAVGTVSNMYTIAETLLGAGRVVSL
jgi:selenium metabolism protein YedF